MNTGHHEENGYPAMKELFAANLIAAELCKLLTDENVLAQAAARAESQALLVLEKIRNILDNEEFSDPACFHRIEAIVDTLAENGIYTSRHDW
ncbi:MAG: hypothetical protein HFG00_03405 [Oscillibacter sp.]|nr:hypothetical protein [Oscillibacter sp.]